jgi:hypothetical protein
MKAAVSDEGRRVAVSDDVSGWKARRCSHASPCQHASCARKTGLASLFLANTPPSPPPPQISVRTYSCARRTGLDLGAADILSQTPLHTHNYTHTHTRPPEPPGLDWSFYTDTWRHNRSEASPLRPHCTDKSYLHCRRGQLRNQLPYYMQHVFRMSRIFNTLAIFSIFVRYEPLSPPYTVGRCKN